MRHTGFLAVMLLLALAGCTRKLPGGNAQDEAEINSLIRQMLKWADSRQSIDLLPVVPDSSRTYYTGLDLEKHGRNLEKLRATDLFAEEFIGNYDELIRTIDRRLRNGEFEAWPVITMPTFTFGNNGSPWCLCQGVPYSKPSPWDFIETEVVDLDSAKGELRWKWGNLGDNPDPAWKEFAYTFRVARENNKWKITYLQGFDLAQSTRRAG